MGMLSVPAKLLGLGAKHKFLTNSETRLDGKQKVSGDKMGCQHTQYPLNSQYGFLVLPCLQSVAKDADNLARVCRSAHLVPVHSFGQIMLEHLDT